MKMKTKLLIVFLCLFSLNVMGQGTIERKKKQTTTQTTTSTSKPKPATSSKPKPQPEKICSFCGNVLSKCKYNLAHPSCEFCNKVIGVKDDACQYDGHHPMCDDCDKPIDAITGACQYNGKHKKCEVCMKPIDGTKSKSCPDDGKHIVLHDVTFSCNAPNAMLTLDGVPAGELPVTLSLQQGQHTLSVYAYGYEDVHQEIVVDGNNNSFKIPIKELASSSTSININNRNNSNTFAKDQALMKRAIKAKTIKQVGIIYTAYVILSPIGIPLWIVGSKKCKRLEREGFDFDRLKIKRKK